MATPWTEAAWFDASACFEALSVINEAARYSRVGIGVAVWNLKLGAGVMVVALAQATRAATNVMNVEYMIRGLYRFTNEPSK